VIRKDELKNDIEKRIKKMRKNDKEKLFIKERRAYLEVRINREIREYTESVFMGLSIRQFLFSVLACGMSVGAYFLLKPLLGFETTSWVCILAATPFAVLGFVKYNGMSAEQFIVAWVKSEILTPKKLLFRNTNIYYELLEEYQERKYRR
jgi:hypothetical protein